MLRYIIPLVLFISVVLFLVFGLNQNPSHLPSALINQPIPTKEVISEDLKGKVVLLNVWASWCVSCVAEHEVLTKIQKSGIPIVGLNYKDRREHALAWLHHYGNPYAFNTFDEEGKIAIEWGVYGTPETFVIDKDGIIRYRHVGPVDWAVWEQKLKPLVDSVK